MKTTEEKWTIKDMLSYLTSAFLTKNPEYQRGEAWDLAQKQIFIDSVLRSYPIPAFFFHEIITNLPKGPSTKYEIVDGQQRLVALNGYRNNDFKLLPPDDKRFRLPPGVRSLPAPWAGLHFRDLAADLQERFETTKITVHLVETTSLADEVRDLFIRLQSGTALTRQQVRDAWPGPIGPFVEQLAGKLARKPSVGLFQAIDRRSTRAEDLDEQVDAHVSDRQSCAQLLKVFLARESDPDNVPSIGTRDLDGLYHEQTDFDVKSKIASRFQDTILLATKVFQRASGIKSSRGAGRKEKFRRVEVLAVVMYLQDMTKGERFRVDIEELAKRLVDPHDDVKMTGKGTSGRAIFDFYLRWREAVTKGLGVHLDPRRTFDDNQKKELRAKADGNCQICRGEVQYGEEEYDHFPIPHRDGGPTEPSNGRLVHRRCHPRPGRPTED